ncbi:MAG: hypothetical protein HY544_04790 [Candidatus Diapherotrites archaeon]|uniref:Uncharacterized protein n=1 Tax=Candidatus Iainarchaeum sp. TaxID=3101447 RepID=A0A8T3YL75_9ARCH|nr:hypothetical protein [Candidatus Diapherotrites archaeon]
MPAAKDQSTILLERKVIELLKRVKDHPRDTYNDIIWKLAQEKLLSKKGVIAADMFGRFPRFSGKTAQQIKDEMRAGWA